MFYLHFRVTKMFPIKSKLVENALLTIGIINSKVR